MGLTISHPGERPMSGGSAPMLAPYRPELDGLRALAVLVVMINHFNRDLLPGGYLGVDIFFVISGYVITSSLLSNVNATLGDFLLTFYVRRMKRLVPALVLFVVVSSLFICLLNPTPNDSLRTAIAALFGFSNLRLLNASTDYFAQAAELNGFTHTWSLGVEEQFYFVFPLLVWQLAHGRGAGEALKKLIFAAAIVSVVSLLGYIVLNQFNSSAAYYLMPTRLWELGVGCLTYLIEKRSPDGMRRIRSVPSGFALAALLATLMLPKDLMVPATIAAVLFSALLIATLAPGSATFGVLTRPAVVYVGLMSYSLYLWHWGVLSLSRLTIGISWTSIPFQVALIFVLAFVSYRFVETPLRRAAWGRRRWIAIARGFSAPLLATVLLAALTGPLTGKVFLGRFVDVPVPSYLEKTWWVDRRTGEYLETCHAQYEFSDELLKKCLTVQPGKRGTIYLLGDSFARNYLPAIKGAFRDHAVAYLTMGGGCAFLPPALAARVPERRCEDYVAQTSAYILHKARAGDAVVIGQYIRTDRVSSEYIGFVETFARELSAQGIPTILLDGTVPPRFRPEECAPLPWIYFEREGCSIGRASVVNAYATFDALAAKAATEVSSLYYAPLRTGLCTGNVCGQNTAKGTPIWHDAGHITESSASELAPLLRAQLAQSSFFERYPFTAGEAP